MKITYFSKEFASEQIFSSQLFKDSSPSHLPFTSHSFLPKVNCSLEVDDSLSDIVRVSIVQKYILREERDHIHVTLIIICYNCSILLLLLLISCCLVDIQMYIQEKNSMYRFWYYPWLQASTGGLGTHPLQIRGGYCIP